MNIVQKQINIHKDVLEQAQADEDIVLIAKLTDELEILEQADTLLTECNTAEV